MGKDSQLLLSIETGDLLEQTKKSLTEQLRTRCKSNIDYHITNLLLTPREIKEKKEGRGSSAYLNEESGKLNTIIQEELREMIDTKRTRDFIRQYIATHLEKHLIIATDRLLAHDAGKAAFTLAERDNEGLKHG